MAGHVTDYQGAPLGTLGGEIELYIVSLKTGHPVALAAEFLRKIFSDSRYASLRLRVSPEYDGRMIEYKSAPGGVFAPDFERVFRQGLKLLLRLAAEFDCLLLPAAHYNGSMAGWAHFTDPGGRFEDNGLRYGRLTTSLPVLVTDPRIPRSLSAQPHCPMPMGNDEERQLAVAVCDVMMALSPAIATIAANSPYGPFESRRLHHWLELPRGNFYLAGSYENLLDHGDELMQAGVISTLTELWYFVRLNAHTCESRSYDMQLTFQDTLAIMAVDWCAKMAIRNGLRYGLLNDKLPSLEDLEERSQGLPSFTVARPNQVPLWNIFQGDWTTLDEGLEELLAFIMPIARDYALDGSVQRFADMATSGHNGAYWLRAYGLDHDIKLKELLTIVPEADGHNVERLAEVATDLRYLRVAEDFAASVHG